MKSLNQIIAELEAFANVHYQIHTFGHGDVWEIAPNSSEIVYPVLWFVPQGATTGLREVTNNFTVLCMDLVRSGEENETEVLSDTLQIILDVVSYYRQQHGEAYIVEFGSNIQPFTERDPDMLSGHSITVSIRQPFNYSECAIPFSAAPTPITPTCSPATIQNAASNPTYQASIASGDNLVLPQVKILDSDGITPILANYIPESDGFVAECSTTCADGTVENSDQTVTVTVGSGDTEEFPDTPISANGDLVINQPSGVAKDLVVRYETQGVAPTTIVSGEVVVPDSFAPDPNRNPFTGNYGATTSGFGTGFQADGYGCFSNLYRWTTEPATSQDCSVEYYCGVLYGNNTFIGFTQVLTFFSSILGNGFTGIRNNGSSLGYFYVNDVYIGTFYNPSTVDDVIKVTWNATDKKFRLYVAGVLTYTSTYTYSGSPYPAAGANAGVQPVAGCFVTRLD